MRIDILEARMRRVMKIKRQELDREELDHKRMNRVLECQAQLKAEASSLGYSLWVIGNEVSIHGV